MMTIERKQDIFLEEYALYGWDFLDTYKWISLVGCLYSLAVKKDPNITVYGILMKIRPDDKHFIKLFEITQMHVMGHIYKTKDKFPTHGIPTAKDIVIEVKRLMDVWIPF